MKGSYRQTDRQTSAGAEPPAPSSTLAPPPVTRTPVAPDPPSPGWPGGEPPPRSLPRGLAAVLLVHTREIRVDMLTMTSPVCEFGSLTSTHESFTNLCQKTCRMEKWILIISGYLYDVHIW